MVWDENINEEVYEDEIWLKVLMKGIWWIFVWEKKWDWKNWWIYENRMKMRFDENIDEKICKEYMRIDIWKNWWKY